MEIERNLFLDPGADPGFDPETAADEAFNDNELKELERLSNVKLSLISVETLVLLLKKKCWNISQMFFHYNILSNKIIKF